MTFELEKPLCNLNVVLVRHLHKFVLLNSNYPSLRYDQGALCVTDITYVRSFS